MCVLAGLGKRHHLTAMCCLPMTKAEATGQLLPSAAHFCPVCLFISNNTLITQLKTQPLSLTEHPTLCSAPFSLHAEPRSSGSGIVQNTSMKPTYHPGPSLFGMPSDRRVMKLCLPPLGRLAQTCKSLQVFPLCSAQILLDSQSHPGKQRDP